MNSRTTPRFRALLAALPRRVQRQARMAYEIFAADSTHPGLQFKKVNDTPPVFSVRIGLHYRALGILKDDYIAWFWVGSHAEYDDILKRF